MRTNACHTIRNRHICKPGAFGECIVADTCDTVRDLYCGDAVAVRIPGAVARVILHTAAAGDRKYAAVCV